MTEPMIDRRHLIALAGAAVAVPLIATPAVAATAGLTVIATIVAAAGQADGLRGALAALAAAARKEHGCLSYALYEDQRAAGHFYTYEHWTNDAALDAHLGSPAMKAAGAKFGSMLASAPVISRLKAI